MQEVLRTQPEMSFLRGFLHKVWAIFEGPTTEAEAQAKLAELKQYAAHHENDGYTKSISFLDGDFKNMTTFLRVPGVQRNSLAETGMRVLRRLERNHDGFRSEKGRPQRAQDLPSRHLSWDDCEEGGDPANQAIECRIVDPHRQEHAPGAVIQMQPQE